MDQAIERFILGTLADHNILTLATVRDDGWPQATTVAYANEGLKVYIATFPEAQKVHNVRHDPRVSFTVDHDEPDWGKIKGLSVGAIAEILDNPADIDQALDVIARKFPQTRSLPMPGPTEITVLRLTPKVISVLDYEKGFGHTDLYQL